jgi:ABC-2 type transport system permease protein
MTLGSVLAFVPVAIGAFLLCFYINFLLGLLCFAMKSMKSIWPIKILIVSGLGGGILPLSFFPQAVFSVISVLPFQYIFYQPLRVFLNSVSQSEYIGILLFQAGWILLLHLVTIVLWQGAHKKFCGAGG